MEGIAVRNPFKHITSICVDLISIIVHPLTRLLTRNRVRIFCYHRVCDLPQTEDSMQSLNICPDSFDQQIAFLFKKGYNAITLEQFIDCKNQGGKLPNKTVIITFDDGYRDNYKNALPILQKYHFTATFFVVTDYIDSEKVFHWLELGEKSLLHAQENKKDWRPLSRGEILDMSSKGADFGSHTKSHCSLNEIDESKAVEELKDSKAYIERLLSKPVVCFSYPYGEFTESDKSLVKAAGYKAAVGTRGGSNTLKSDFFELRRTLIDGQDSFGKFVRKAEGAYDWLEYLLPVVGFVKQKIITRRETKCQKS